MENKALVYIAGCYSSCGDREENIKIADKFAAKAINDGYIPIVLFKMLHNFDKTYLDHWDNLDFIEDICFPLLRRCDIVWFLPGWEKSFGASAEFGFAKALGKPIKFVE